MNDNAEELPENVAFFPGASRNKYDPKVMLSGAMRASLTDVLILGWDEEGDLFMSSSDYDRASVLWLIEKAKVALLNAD